VPFTLDMEKDGQNGNVRSSGSSPTSDYEGALVSHKDGLLKRIWDGFKRDPNASITRPAALGADGKVFDVEAAAQRTADSPLARRLKGRHLQMIAIGGSIGEEHARVRGSRASAVR
jgi:amino acid transporter